MAETDALVETRVDGTRCARVETLVPERQEHVLVDLGLKLELEMRRGQPATRAIGHVHEVAHPLDELTNSVEIGSFREPRREHFDLDRAVLRVTDAHGFAFFAVGRAQKGFYRGRALEAVEALDVTLDPTGDQHTVSPNTAAQ
jgi:hypothetical protein